MLHALDTPHGIECIVVVVVVVNKIRNKIQRSIRREGLHLGYSFEAIFKGSN